MCRHPNGSDGQSLSLKMLASVTRVSMLPALKLPLMMRGPTPRKFLDRDKTGTSGVPKKNAAPQEPFFQAFAEPRSKRPERAGFEPAVPEGTPVFETGPFSRSGTSPLAAMIGEFTRYLNAFPMFSPLLHVVALLPWPCSFSFSHGPIFIGGAIANQMRFTGVGLLGFCVYCRRPWLAGEGRPCP